MMEIIKGCSLISISLCYSPAVQRSIKHKSIHIERNVELTNRFNVLSSNLHTIMPGTFSSLESGSLFVSAVTLLKNRGFSISLLNRNREEAAGKKRANGRKREA